MLLRVVLELTFVPIAFLSIFAVMVLADPTTPWSMGTWHGPGPSVDFWKIAALLALGWTILVLGWRGAKAAFKFLAVSWHLGLTTASFVYVLDSRDHVVQGDAIGFSMSLGILAPAYCATALACVLVFVARDLRRGTATTRSVSPLQRRNRLAACVAVVALLGSGVAFALDFDELGIIVCIAAMVACHETVRPVNPSAELHRAFVIEGSAVE